MSKLLKDLLSDSGKYNVKGDTDILIKGVTADSRQVKEGYLFVAVKGITSDGHDFIGNAINNGAVAIVGELDAKQLKIENTTYIEVKDSKKELSVLAASWFDNPAKKLKIIGVTGTDGKTSTSSLIYWILKLAGKKVGLISTVSAKIGDEEYDTGFHVTNPEPIALQEFLAKMVNKGCEYAVLEVTSHGLDQERVYGINFEISVLTNITHEHIDYHKTFENYAKAKAKLFNNSKLAIINSESKSNIEKFIDNSVRKIYFDKDTLSGKVLDSAKSRFQEEYNIINSAAATLVTKELGITESAIASAIETFPGVIGRMQEIKNEKGIKVIVDFAHTPNALESVLKSVRSQKNKTSKVISVFGCAGERDIKKRQMMGEISAKNADISVFTAEDPRSENVEDIVKEMVKGSDKIKKAEVHTIPERGEAIYYAINKLAKKGDVVVICGKGHERSMGYNGIEYPWSDEEAVKDALKGKVKKINREIIANSKTEGLREKYPEFIYEKYSYNVDGNVLVITFEFRINPGIVFKPKIFINNITETALGLLDKKVLENLIFNLGLSEIPSYWKATASQKIIINAGSLNEDQINWWHKLLINGMGQFFYENKIDYRDKNYITIVSFKDRKKNKLANINNTKILIPVGGGKDSAVTLDLLNKKDGNAGVMILNEIISAELISKANNISPLVIKREIDPTLLSLNKRGYLNGHTPFSAYLAFLSILCGYLFDFGTIAFSNERSSNEGNVDYLDSEVNHQYSKTLEFENDFRDYNSKYLSNINYFSFLRPLYEVQISKIFSKMDKYFGLIRSCNVGQKTNSWCCRCPKCLSTYILLYPFLGRVRILEIFPKDLFEDEKLYGILEELLLNDKTKPFECVGTRYELRVCLAYVIMNMVDSPLPKLLQLAKKNLKLDWTNLSGKMDSILIEWENKNNLSQKFEDVLKNKI